MRCLRIILIGLAASVTAVTILCGPASAGPTPGRKKPKSPVSVASSGNVGVTVQVTAAAPVPSQFRLDQNHPNPFNSSTVITYACAGAANVMLRIYNILGQEVAILVSGRQPAGCYDITWDAKDQGGRPLPSGIYLYKLTAGTHVETKRMVLLK